MDGLFLRIDNTSIDPSHLPKLLNLPHSLLGSFKYAEHTVDIFGTTYTHIYTFLYALFDFASKCVTFDDLFFV